MTTLPRYEIPIVDEDASLQERSNAWAAYMEPIREALRTPESTVAMQANILEGIKNGLEEQRVKFLEEFPLGTVLPPTLFERAANVAEQAFKNLLGADLSAVVYEKDPPYTMRNAYPTMTLHAVAPGIQSIAFGQYLYTSKDVPWEHRVSFKTDCSFLLDPKVGQPIRYFRISTQGHMDFYNRTLSGHSRIHVFPLGTFDEPTKTLATPEDTGFEYISRGIDLDKQPIERSLDINYQRWVDRVLPRLGIPLDPKLNDYNKAYYGLFPFYLEGPAKAEELICQQGVYQSLPLYGGEISPTKKALEKDVKIDTGIDW